MIRFQSDTAGLTLRHTDADLLIVINQSIQRFREMVSDAGFSYYLTPSAAASFTTGATSPYAFKVLDIASLSPTAVRIYGIDVTVSGAIHSLDAVDFAERNKYQYSDGPSTGVPVAFSMYSDTKVAILPPPDATYAYTIWYLPQVTELSAGSDTFDGKAGWEEWIVWDVFHKLIHRDTYPQLFASVATERDRLQADIVKRARNLQRVGPMVKRDTRGDKRAKMGLARRSWLR
jgi:hypothetical protein